MNKKNEKAFSAIKIIFVCLVLILLSGVGVITMATQVENVSIKLSNGYEMKVLTSKTKVSEILKENNIIVKENERVIPDLEEEITPTKKITISDKSIQEVEVAKISESDIDVTLDTLLKAYDTITEKIEIVEETIPFETVTKDVSDGASSTKNKVIQQGEDGLRRVTYKIKYQNEIEIEKTKIAEEIVKEPIERIVQVQSNVITSRASTMSRTESVSSSDTSSGTVKIYKVTAYCSCSKCCGGKANGRTASGTQATAGRTVAAPSNFAFGTKLIINGKEYVVEDRGGAIKGNRIDMYVNSHAQALAWGVKYLPVQVKN